MERACQVHRRHYPTPLMLHDHHIQPAAMGGPSTPDNMVIACPTGHMNIHAVLASLVFGTGRPKATVSEKQLAAEGYRRWLAAGKPGNPHASYGLTHPDQPAGH
jgi:HNH endonuclease